MSYLALARKYRPQTFDDLVGQPHVTTTLTRAIESGRIGQAYLFAGQRGVGKTSAARILAKGLNCSKKPTATPCQTCPSCTAIHQGNSLDVLEIDGASNRGIEEIRGLRETVKFAPTQGRYRIYIIDEVHMLTPEAFNALLKTLEEPPAHVRFIFATTAPQKLPATILSRCQRFDFRRLDGKTIAASLKAIGKTERVTADEAALFAIARAADGSLRDAEVIFEQLISFASGAITEQDVSRLLGATEQETLVAWMQAIADHQADRALAVLSQQLEQGRDVTQLFTGLLLHVRNLLILRATLDTPSRNTLLDHVMDVPEEQRAALDAQAARFSQEELLVMAQVLTGAYELSRRSPFTQVILELAVIRLASRESWGSLEQILQRLDRLAVTSPAAAPPTVLSAGGARSQAPVTPPSVQVVKREANPALQDIQAQWPNVLERLARQKMSLAAYLMNAIPVGLGKDTIQIGLPASRLHQEVVSGVEHVRLVERVLADVLGRSWTVEYTTLPELPAGVESPTEALPPIVQDIVKLFDATIIKPSVHSG